MLTPQRLGLALALLVLAIAAPAASAATRSASPTGSGSACTAAAPCGIETAISGASDNDEIALAGGDYGSPASPMSTFLDEKGKALNIHGPATGTRARIYSNSPSGVFGLFSPDSLLSYVDLVYTGSTYLPAVWGTPYGINHVTVDSTGAGILFNPGTKSGAYVWNTVIRARGEGSTGLQFWDLYGYEDFTGTREIRNVTVVADGLEAYALSISGGGMTNSIVKTTVTMTNTILVSAHDIWVEAAYDGDAVSLDIDHSRFVEAQTGGAGTPSVTPNDVNGNISAAPLFVNLAGGNLHQAAGSPTIDAGGSARAGETDIDGEARAMGAATDMGADEFYVEPVPADDRGNAPPADIGGQTSAPGTTDNGGTPPPPPPATAPGPVAKTCKVPRLSGLTLKRAKAALAKSGCKLGKVASRRSAMKAGKVISQTAKPGKRVAAGTKIALVIGRR